MPELGPTVVFSGGGTGGHLYPALTLASGLQALRPDVRPFYVGAERGIEAGVLPEREIPYLLLPVKGLVRGGGSWGSVILSLAQSVVRAVKLFLDLQPSAVVVTGGYAGAPVGIAAMLLGVPLALQEQNSVPGATTRLLSRRARQIHLAFPEAVKLLPAGASTAVRVSGNPIRTPAGVAREEARKAFGLQPDGKVVLVVGGSQGSSALNRALLEMVTAVRSGKLDRPEDLQILWSTGPNHFEHVIVELEKLPEWLHVLPYIEEMPLALGAADLAVSRAGAMGTSEFLAWGIPAILVPLPTAAADHQTKNARTLVDAGVALMVREDELTGMGLLRQVVSLLGDVGRMEAMRRAAEERGRPGATLEISAALCELLPAAEGVGAVP